MGIKRQGRVKKNPEHDVRRSEEKDNPSPRGEEEEEDDSNDDACGL